MKLFKLWVHQYNFSEDALIINPKEFPDCEIGDVLEIYHPGEESSTRLLLQINSIRTDFQQKDTISILQSVANKFHLRTYGDVKVNKVDPQDVVIELVEILIKDQYFSRNDMWRLSKALTDSCVYVGKKVSACAIGSQIHELWMKGEKVSCGVITKDTRVVFRSLTAQVFLFIQMSQEMWDFDLNGDLYFEKTINGFLYELFTKWKEQKATHEVTIVLFSRTFYDAKHIDDFPQDKRASVLQDCYGRYYEDFYHVIVQGVKRDDWLPVLVTLKHHFNQYPKYINCCYDDPDMPTGCNSSAFEGNVLEAVNLTMNVFERHFVDRNFERTGQGTTIITPGSGVFEVDRALTSIIKQRMIDSGVATDLVCMAEQPLHSVPLFKFQNKGLGQGVSIGDDYNIAHWINHSFYTSPKAKSMPDAFVQRIRLPEVVLNYIGGHANDNPYRKGLHKNFQEARDQKQTNQLPDRINYDEYDANIFRKGPGVKPLTRHSSPRIVKSLPEFKAGSSSDLEKLSKSRDEMTSIKRTFSPPLGVGGGIAIPTNTKSPERQVTFQPIRPRLSSSLDFTSYATKELQRRKDAGMEDIGENLPSGQRFVVGSAGASRDILGLGPVPKGIPRRTLFNPFRPLNIPCKWTCNRHRWAHVFPKGRDGEIVRRHFEKQSSQEDTAVQDTKQSPTVGDAFQALVQARKRAISETSKGLPEGTDSVDLDDDEDLDDAVEITSLQSDSPVDLSYTHTPQEITLTPTPKAQEHSSSSRRRSTRPNFFFHKLDKTTLEHDWTAAIKTSVDWKSLTVPACLPLTSEYNPDKESLESDYLEFHYELCVGVDEMDSRQRSTSNPNRHLDGSDEQGRSRHPTTVENTLIELVAQRLSRGFQLSTKQPKMSPDRPQSFPSVNPNDDYYETEEFFLSLGRNLHRLSAMPNRSQINITRYRPRNPSLTTTVQYRYRLWAEKCRGFQPTEVEFQHDELDNYNWNYLDQHISGDQDFSELLESLKYWKSRFILLPLPRRKKSSNGGPDEKSDTVKSDKGDAARIEGLLKYIEMLNGIKRTKARRRPFSPRSKREIRIETSKEPRIRSNTLPPQNNTTKGEVSLGVTPLTSKPMSSSLGPESLDPSRPHTPLSESISEVSSTSTEDSSTSLENDNTLGVRSPLETIAQAMLDPKNEMTFLPAVKGLGTKCFLAVEAVWWIMHHVDGACSQKVAVALAQKMVDAKIILHASNSRRQNFLYGFMVFYVTPEKIRTETEAKPSRYAHYLRALMEQQLKDFQGDWFEVAITPCRAHSPIPAFLAPDSVLETYPLTSPTLRSLASVRRGRARSVSTPVCTESDCGPAHKFVNMDCDPQRKSDRPEWCIVRYHGNYNPAHAYEIEVHWIETTSSIVHDMIQSWARKATSCGFVLIPAPVSPFPDPVGNNVDPLRLPVFIPINLSGCVGEGQSNAFQGFDVSSHRLRRFLFQEAILEKFGFLKDSPFGQSNNSYSFVAPPVQCRADDYVHSSGAAFVRINDQDEDAMRELYGPGFSGVTGVPGYGFYWENNFMLTKRWRSAATGDLESARKLQAEFEDFCSDSNGALKAFWEANMESLRRATEETVPVTEGTGTETARVDDSESETSLASTGRLMDSLDSSETFSETESISSRKEM